MSTTRWSMVAAILVGLGSTADAKPATGVCCYNLCRGVDRLLVVVASCQTKGETCPAKSDSLECRPADDRNPAISLQPDDPGDLECSVDRVAARCSSKLARRKRGVDCSDASACPVGVHTGRDGDALWDSLAPGSDKRP